MIKIGISLAVLAMSAQASAGIYGKDRVKFSKSSGLFKNAEIIPCEGQEVQAYLPKPERKPRFDAFDKELRDGLERQRVSASFLRDFGLENPDCIRVVIASHHTRGTFIDFQGKVEDYIDRSLYGSEAVWRRDNADILRDQKFGKTKIVTVLNPRDRRLKCTGRVTTTFSKKLRLWNVTTAEEFSNVNYLAFVYAVNTGTEEQIAVSSGYGCRYRGETMPLSDLKRWGNYKDIEPLSPQAEDVTFDR